MDTLRKYWVFKPASFPCLAADFQPEAFLAMHEPVLQVWARKEID